MDQTAVMGVCLGILMGSLSGFVFWKFIDTLFKASLKQTPIIGGQVLGIFAFWVGGNWLRTSFLESVNSAETLYYYILTLTCIFGSVSVAKVIDRVVKQAKDKARLENARGSSDD